VKLHQLIAKLPAGVGAQAHHRHLHARELRAVRAAMATMGPRARRVTNTTADHNSVYVEPAQAHAGHETRRGGAPGIRTEISVRYHLAPCVAAIF
jgi:hypothetical protein